MKTVAIVDYGMSNLRSVSKALEHTAGREWQVLVSNQPALISKADKVVFPGQGAIGNCITLLHQSGMAAAILQTLASYKPFLGICLGMQTLLTASEESGGTEGFNLIPGKVCRFSEPLLDHLKVPHMGWNQVQPMQAHPLWQDIPENSRFYFVHSYYAVPQETSVIAAITSYGKVRFASAIAQENVFAVQFHPEKSQHSGLMLLKNFLQW